MATSPTCYGFEPFYTQIEICTNSESLTSKAFDLFFHNSSWHLDGWKAIFCPGLHHWTL